MATNRNFSNMLNEYLPSSLLAEEMIKRDYFLQNVEKDNSWLGGNLIVPFISGKASTVKLGGLAAASEINQTKTVRGQISSQPEVWGSLIFNQRDLYEHGKLSEQNFLKLLPGELDDMMQFMKQTVSMQFTNGAKISKAAGNGTVGGTIVVERVERFELGQPAVIDDNDSAALKVWIGAIDMESDTITCYTDMALTTLADLSPYTVAQEAAFYVDGGETLANRFSSLKDLLLSAANGGSANIYGVSKLASPYTQAIQISGASITAANILDKIFDAQTVVRNKGKGLPDKAVVSYKHLGSILKLIEQSKGAYKQVDSPKASLYGWTEVEIMGVKGKITIVALQEMDNDVIYILDMKALKIYSNGFFKKRVAEDGKEYFEVRNTSGYQYIVDFCFFGDMVLERPSRCGIIHSVANY